MVAHSFVVTAEAGRVIVGLTRAYGRVTSLDGCTFTATSHVPFVAPTFAGIVQPENVTVFPEIPIAPLPQVVLASSVNRVKFVGILSV